MVITYDVLKTLRRLLLLVDRFGGATEDVLSTEVSAETQGLRVDLQILDGNEEFLHERRIIGSRSGKSGWTWSEVY